MIVFDNVGKAYRNRKGEINWLIRNFSGAVEPGKSLGILAPPSQGKTTFISMAAGNEKPSEGSIVRRGEISWPWGSNSVISGRLSGRQNIRFLSDLYGRNFNRVHEFVREFADLGKYLDGPLRNYNGEMKARLGISLLFAMDFEFILVDNSMDGGDMTFRRKCAKYLEDNRNNLTFLIATERPNLVSKYCQTAGVLFEGQLTLHDRVDQALAHFNKVNLVDA